MKSSDQSDAKEKGSTGTLALPVNPWLIAAAVVLPTFMEVLDTTIVSVALPYIAGNLSASTSQATWVQTSYLISNAIVLPASAWFSAFFGRKRYFIVSIAVFAVASLLSGIAPSLGFLVAAQLLMGAGGGALQPLSQAILMESFPPEKRGKAMSVWALGVVVAPVLGPVVGGWITDHYTWRWLFYINVPVSVVALWMIQQFITDPPYLRQLKPGRIDAIGFGLLTLWLATMQTVLDKGQEDDWFSALWIRWFSLISIISLVTLIVWELREQSPIVNLRVLTNRNFLLGFVIVTLIGVLSYSPLTLLPLFQQNLLGYTALQSGLAQYPRGIGSLIVLPLVGFLSSRMDNRKIIVAGIILTASSSLMLGNINLEVAKSNFNLANLLQGAGVATAFVPLATTAMGLLRNEQMGNATGLFNLMRNLGGSIGISMVTTMLARGAQAHQTVLVAHLTPFDPNYQAALLANQAALAPGVGPAQAQLMAPGVIYNSLLQQSSLLAYVDDFRRLALLSFASILAVLWMKRVSAKKSIAVH
jgi:DHA2 family multidrug resistance protein